MCKAECNAVSRKPISDAAFDEAFARLLQGLHFCFGANIPVEESASGPRYRQILAQKEIVNFLCAIGRKKFGVEFFRLASALYDLDDHITHPILAPKKGKARASWGSGRRLAYSYGRFGGD